MGCLMQWLVSELESDKLEFVPYQRKAEMRTIPEELMTTFHPSQ